MRNTILIPQDLSAVGKDYLKERGYEIKMGSGVSRDTLIEEIADCAAVLVRTAEITDEVIEAGKHLKVLAKHGIGVDNIDLLSASKHGIYVTNTPLANAGTVAEHSIGLMIALARNIVRSDRAVRNNNYQIRNELLGMDMEGKTLGVIGLGRIGTLVARKAFYGFEMRVIGYDPFVSPEQVGPEIKLEQRWENIFSQSDLISLHMPLTEKTYKIIGTKEFALMKRSAYLISMSRGGIVDETALINALKQGEIAGAGLDVLEHEPPHPDNPLLAMEQVILTPHNSALTKEATDRMSLHAAQSIDEVLSGKIPSWPVNTPQKIR